ncbi:MAG: dihydrofolate reductase [Phycisphaerales bacterium]|nr:dihydrofolate reductase [Phycisphaerales bacterium]
MTDSQPFDFRAFHATHKIAMIVACSENGVIGSDGDLPWHLPADLRHFMRSTKGCSVIMGRKTFESLDKPLPNRLNIVLSRSMSDNGGGRDDGVRFASCIEDAIEIAQASDMEMPIWIAGGGHVYKEAMSQPGLVDLIVRTRVHAQIEGDTVFPELDPQIWKLSHSELVPTDDRHVFAMTLEWWVRQP